MNWRPLILPVSLGLLFGLVGFHRPVPALWTLFGLVLGMSLYSLWNPFDRKKRLIFVAATNVAFILILLGA